MFWDRVAWVYDVFANGINRRANRAMCAAVAAHIGPEDEVLECACGTGLLTGVIAARCRALTATDFSEKMLAQAERKDANCRNVRFEPSAKRGTSFIRCKSGLPDLHYSFRVLLLVPAGYDK